MGIYVLDNLDGYTEKDLQRDMTLLPQWRRQKAQEYKHLAGKRDCTLSYLLLCQALEKEYGVTEQPSFIIGEHGKPALAEYPHIHFNLSHCSKAIACVVADVPVGIDTESTDRKISQALVNHTMSPDECKIIEKDSLHFFRLWTQKEAVVKLKGTGLQDSLHTILSPENLKGAKLTTEEHLEKGYILSIATKTDI